jgi:hypothetical protein
MIVDLLLLIGINNGKKREAKVAQRRAGRQTQGQNIEAEAEDDKRVSHCLQKAAQLDQE